MGCLCLEAFREKSIRHRKDQAPHRNHFRQADRYTLSKADYLSRLSFLRLKDELILKQRFPHKFTKRIPRTLFQNLHIIKIVRIYVSHGRCLVWLVGGQKRSATQPDYLLLTIGYLPLSLHKKGPITILTFSILRYEDPIHCHHMQPQTDAKCRPNYSHILNNTIRIFYLACSG